MKRIVQSLSIAILACNLLGCSVKNTRDLEKRNMDSIVVKRTNTMKSFISIFEIPATNISRAIDFYQAILGIKIEKMDIPGMQMGLFPYEGQMVYGTIIEGKPSADGLTLYLNAGDDLQAILDRIGKNGGAIITPKTRHADDSGFFAIFLDSEGNKMGLHSPN